jgi:hypothetical protein
MSSAFSSQSSKRSNDRLNRDNNMNNITSISATPTTGNKRVKQTIPITPAQSKRITAYKMILGYDNLLFKEEPLSSFLAKECCDWSNAVFYSNKYQNNCHDKKILYVENWIGYVRQEYLSNLSPGLSKILHKVDKFATDLDSILMMQIICNKLLNKSLVVLTNSSANDLLIEICKNDCQQQQPQPIYILQTSVGYSALAPYPGPMNMINVPETSLVPGQMVKEIRTNEGNVYKNVKITSISFTHLTLQYVEQKDVINTIARKDICYFKNNDDNCVFDPFIRYYVGAQPTNDTEGCNTSDIQIHLSNSNNCVNFTPQKFILAGSIIRIGHPDISSSSSHALYIKEITRNNIIIGQPVNVNIQEGKITTIKNVNITMPIDLEKEVIHIIDVLSIEGKKIHWDEGEKDNIGCFVPGFAPDFIEMNKGQLHPLNYFVDDDYLTIVKAQVVNKHMLINRSILKHNNNNNNNSNNNDPNNSCLTPSTATTIGQLVRNFSNFDTNNVQKTQITKVPTNNNNNNTIAIAASSASTAINNDSNKQSHVLIDQSNNSNNNNSNEDDNSNNNKNTDYSQPFLSVPEADVPNLLTIPNSQNSQNSQNVFDGLLSLSPQQGIANNNYLPSVIYPNENYNSNILNTPVHPPHSYNNSIPTTTIPTAAAVATTTIAPIIISKIQPLPNGLRDDTHRCKLVSTLLGEKSYCNQQTYNAIIQEYESALVTFIGVIIQLKSHIDECFERLGKKNEIQSIVCKLKCRIATLSKQEFVDMINQIYIPNFTLDVGYYHRVVIQANGPINYEQFPIDRISAQLVWIETMLVQRQQQIMLIQMQNLQQLQQQQQQQQLQLQLQLQQQQQQQLLQALPVVVQPLPLRSHNNSSNRNLFNRLYEPKN